MANMNTMTTGHEKKHVSVEKTEISDIKGKKWFTPISFETGSRKKAQKWKTLRTVNQSALEDVMHFDLHRQEVSANLFQNRC